jgi:uncharacterized protein YkwD
LRRTPAHARRAGRSTRTIALLSVAGLLLCALALTAFLLPASSGNAPRRTAADPPQAGSAVFGTAPAASPSARPAAPAARPSPTSAAPSRSPRRTATAAPGSGDSPGSQASPSSSGRSAATGDAALENQVTVLVNQERAEAGCDTVRADERLDAAASGHSRDMATDDYFSHTAPDGSTFVDRAAAAGYPREQAGGENIAMGYRTAAAVMAGWMDSAGHRANILNCDFEAIGVGLARDSGGTPYWTQVFGRA